MTESNETRGTTQTAIVPSTGTTTNLSTSYYSKAAPTVYVPAPAVVLDERAWKSPRNLFLSINTHTAPSAGHEGDMYGEMLEGLGFNRDDDGNYWGEMGTGSTSLFAAHMDTADWGDPKKIEMYMSADGAWIVTGGKTILGADDRAGMTVLLWMWKHEVPGYYVFFVGEERGCTGSHAAALDFGKTVKKLGITINRMVCFDRKGKTSVITDQASGVCCSDTFALALAAEFAKHGVTGLKPDPTGTVTDSNSFSHLIPECTNVSIGYENAHSSSERLDWAWLNAVARASVLVDWEGLPTTRNPAIRSGRNYGNYGGYYGNSYYGNSKSAAPRHNGVYGGEGWVGEDDDTWGGYVQQDMVPPFRGEAVDESGAEAPAEGGQETTEAKEGLVEALLIDAPFDLIYPYKGDPEISELEVHAWVQRYPAAAAALVHLVIKETPDLLDEFGTRQWVDPASLLAPGDTKDK